ncbi:olfactory receptor 6N1-like [Rhinatrema bivittatum]|uniref:olfactory receptor 6N1-like n=1 Tax=Rhinatrema bivittatum TaxID=194408 RepID=UPI00112D6198|nr:olfactory receptor 6N1-like [Rhinatrema bivittatum]
MNEENETFVTEFVLVGHLSLLNYPKLFFTLLLMFYLISQVGNALIISLVKLDSRLHTPMYFFLCNLSLVEIFYTSVTFPTILSVSLARVKWLSVGSCLLQICFFHFLGAVECLLLTVMAYDRYVAICRPLHYRTMMSGTVCMSLAVTCWLSGFFNFLALILLTSRLRFCGAKTIANFFCDIPPLFKLACGDISINKVMLTVGDILVGILPCLLIVISYAWIISTILKIHSSQGRKKVFSTCASHLTVVCIFFSTSLLIYMKPSSSYFSDWEELLSLVYTVLTPMLNPLIYSLRNNEVKAALKKVFSSKISSECIRRLT